MQPYAIINETQFAYDGVKRDSISLPVVCEICHVDIPPDVPCWRHWDRYVHLDCATTIVGNPP